MPGRGLKMQDDITDGVQWLVQQGIADPKRIGLRRQLAATPRCGRPSRRTHAAAVDYVGVSNLFATFAKSIPPYWEAHADKMQDMSATLNATRIGWLRPRPAARGQDQDAAVRCARRQVTRVSTKMKATRW